MERNSAVEVMRKHFPLLDTIKDGELATKVANIWYDLWKNSKWERIEDAIYNPLCPEVSLITHTRSVTHGAYEFAKITNEVYGDELNFDLLLVGALLHDVSKLLEYEPGEDNAIKSKKGKLFQHGFLGAYQAFAEGLPDEVVHILICHTADSRVIPQTPEALIIYCVDVADADLNKLKNNAPLLIVNKHK